MRVIRNLYFWLILGTILFIGGIGWSSSVHTSKQYREARAEEGEDPQPMPPFLVGFVTACAVGLFWFAIIQSMNPPVKSEDEATNVKVSKVSWVLAVRKKTSNDVVFLGPDTSIAEDDETFEPYIHKMPCSELNGVLDFWGHHFSRECFCRPDIGDRVNDRDVVIHYIRLD